MTQKTAKFFISYIRVCDPCIDLKEQKSFNFYVKLNSCAARNVHIKVEITVRNRASRNKALDPTHDDRVVIVTARRRPNHGRRPPKKNRFIYMLPSNFAAV